MKREILKNQTHNITTLHRQQIFCTNQIINCRPTKNQTIPGNLLRDHLSHEGLQFVVAESSITYHSTYGETNNNHEEADTLLIHCITPSKRDGKRVWVYASDVDVVVLLIVHHNLLSCRNVYYGVSAEKTNIDSLLELLVSEHVKCLLTLHCLTGCNTAGKFHVSKESWTKLFLQIKDQDIVKAFESLQEEVMLETIDYLAKFVCY